MQYLRNSLGGPVVAPFPPAHMEKPPRDPSRNGEKTNDWKNQTEPATDLPHFAILVYVIKPKTGFVGDQNVFRLA